MSFPHLPKSLGVSSLRGRYLLAAAVVALVVLAGAWLIQAYVADTSRLSTANIAERNRVAQSSGVIRDALWQAEGALKAYALSPAPELSRVWRKRLAVATSEVEKLLSNQWIADAGQRQTVRDLWAELSRLSHEAQALKTIRDNTQLLFPYMPIMLDVMAPANMDFDTAATLAMEELAAEIPDPRRAPTYRLLVETRHLWAQMINVFRIFLANLSGTFGDAEDGLEAQSANVEMFFQQVEQRLGRLAQAEQQYQLGPQATASLQQMGAAAHTWFSAYQRVKSMSQESWRSDVPMMQQVIQPLLDRAWQRLVTLDRGIELSAARDLTILANVASRISHALWALALVGMVFILVGYVYFDRTVLRPVALVARALKAELPGAQGVELPAYTIEETRDLIDAFAEMRHQVYTRQLALEHQALHDALTGLPNRILLQDRLQQGVLAASRQGHPLALIMMDLDRFKEINDTLGHQVGDVVLQEVGARLIQVLRESDTVSRLGGDEFALVLPQANEEQAVRVAKKIVTAMEQVMEIDGQRLYVGGSLGIALYPQHGDNSHTLIQRADVAMYVAKRRNGGFSLYDAEQDPHSRSRLALVSDLRSALDGGALELYYQPKLDISTGIITGVEALLRWQHPQRGMILPEEIIPVAEQTGLIRPLCQWVLGRAIQQCADWRRRGIELSMAVNLSVWNLRDPVLEAQIRELLMRSELPAEYLELEITESAMMAEGDIGLLKRLNAMGVRLAVDDYGTGFSSLAHLKTAPLAELKIDKTFVRDMTEDENDAVIVRSTIDLAHNLGRKVVAEGVETKEIWDVLEILGCDTAQGYYVSPALPVADLERWMGTSRWVLPRRHGTGVLTPAPGALPA